MMMSQSDTLTINPLITDHIDIWTSAILAKSTSGRGSNKKYELYGITKLRELILELAVRGKLVPQDPNDEPASMLLEKIAAEKAQLVKEGKIKKSKPLAEISEDEKLFDVSQGWTWCRLQDIGHDWGQKKPDVDFTYIDVGSVNKELGLIEGAKVVSTEEAPSRARKLVKKGTVIYSTVRPYLLNIAVVDKDFFPEPIASTAFAIIHPLEGVSSSFVYRYLRSPSFVSYVESCQTGIAYPAINDKQFFNGLIHLPPTNEQHRIVAKVDELMLLCDDLEQQTEASIDAHATLVEVLLTTLTDSADVNELAQNWARLSENFDSLFTTEQSIEALKQTVLQLAVMGKLVPQDPNDEPASVLLEKIAQEKERLVKEKKIKKEKPLPSISKDEKLFDIPNGWEWVKLEDVVIIQSGITKGRKLTGRELIAVPYLRVANVQRGHLLLDSMQLVQIPVEEVDKYEVLSRDLLITEGGDWDKVGRTAIWNNELPYVAHQNHIFKARIFLEIQNELWLEAYLNAPYARSYFAGSSKQTTNLASINKTQLRRCLVVLPPISEQQRIMTKLDELMQICDQLKANLQQSQVTQVQLTDALVEQALA